MIRARTASIAAVVATAVAAAGALTASAQIPLTTTTTTTTTTTRPPATTTTTIPLRPRESTTTTTPPKPASEPSPGPAPGPDSGGRPPPAGDTPNPAAPSEPGDADAGGPGAEGPGPARTPEEPPGGPLAPSGGPGSPPVAPPLAAGVVPEDAQRVINSIRRSSPNSTKRLMRALQALRSLGLSDAEVIRVGFGRFPVAGPTTFTDDWYFPRFVPSFHFHQGTDLFAACGTPARAPADGILKLSQGGSGGLAAYVYEPNGTYHYLAHLQRFVPTQQSGQQVKVGQTIGYVGDTGNAVGGPCHIHFEYHPAPAREMVSGKGKNRKVTVVTRSVPIGTRLPPVNPKPHLDAWLEQALARVPHLVAALESRPRALVATGLTRRLADGRTGAFPAPAVPPRSQLLWATSVNPAGGAWRLAQAEATSLANDIDWARLARKQQARLEEEQRARHLTNAILTPLTPPAVRTVPDAGVD